jgi:hypothetical protein
MDEDRLERTDFGCDVKRLRQGELARWLLAIGCWLLALRVPSWALPKINR